MTGEPRYFLTAYGLARKHGFEGSEEEWLESLIGPVPVLQVGEVVTLPAGRPAYVELNRDDPRYPVLVFGIPRGEGMEDALMRTGGKMIGALDMNNYRLMNIPEPSADGDAVSKAYVELIRKIASAAQSAAHDADEHAGSAESIAKAALPRTGGKMTGGVDLGGNGITNLAAPTGDNHAANKGYVDTKVAGAHLEAQVTVTASGWSASAPYTQAVNVNGILATDRVHWGVVYSGDAKRKLSQKEAFAMVDDLDSADGQVTFTCFEEKPDVDLTIQLEVNR